MLSAVGESTELRSFAEQRDQYAGFYFSKQGSIHHPMLDTVTVSSQAIGTSCQASSCAQGHTFLAAKCVTQSGCVASYSFQHYLVAASPPPPPCNVPASCAATSLLLPPSSRVFHLLLLQQCKRHSGLRKQLSTTPGRNCAERLDPAGHRNRQVQAQ